MSSSIETVKHPAINYLSKLFLPTDFVLFGVLDKKTKQPKPKMEQYITGRDDSFSDETLGWLKEENDSGKNTYVCMSAMKPREGVAQDKARRTKEDVSAIRAVYIEIDEDGDNNLNSVLENATWGDIPKPHFVITSSPHRFQIVWLVESFDAATQELTNEALVQKYGADPHATDCVRFLRVPGFANANYESRPIATVVENFDGPRYKPADFKIDLTLVKKPIVVANDGPILKGDRNSTLASIAGKWREAGLDPENLESALLKKNDERCDPPLPESEVKTIAASISRYPVGKPTTVLSNGVPVDQLLTNTPPSSSSSEDPTVILERINKQKQERESEIEEEMSQAQVIPYPEFPRWVMENTSIYTGFAKPLSDNNMRFPEYMFMPAMAIVLNYAGTRIAIKGVGSLMPNIYLLSIGRRGVIIKSGCAQDAMKYLNNAGILKDATPNLSNADGYTLAWTAGSPEGFGMEMSRLNCKNGVLFYDELKTLANKVKIENSNLGSALLTFYESGKYQNTVKGRKENFSLEAGTYCVSLIACVTDKNFLEEWSKLSGGSTGLEDRFFFLYQPSKFKPRKPYDHVDTYEAALETRRLIDKAVAQGTFPITDRSPLDLKYANKELGNRGQIRAQKWALGFAIDLGRTEIDSDCLSRGIALSEYEVAVKRYLKAFESNTRTGAIQMEIVTRLQQSRNRMNLTELEHDMNFLRHGTVDWDRAYNGLLSKKVIREKGRGVKGDPKVVELIRHIASDADEVE